VIVKQYSSRPLQKIRSIQRHYIEDRRWHCMLRFAILKLCQWLCHALNGLIEATASQKGVLCMVKTVCVSRQIYTNIRQTLASNGIILSLCT
jgi:hypothetical protein